MSDVGFQPRGRSANGIWHIIITRHATVGDRVCKAGDILEVYEDVNSGRGHERLLHSDKRVYSGRAQKLIEAGAAQIYTLKPGDRVVSTDGETAALEVATDPGPAKAERALSQRGKSGAI